MGAQYSLCTAVLPTQMKFYIRFIIIALWTLSSIMNCSEFNLETYGHDGLICFKCPPGHYVDVHCQRNFEKSKCKPCPDGHYQHKSTRFKYCYLCDQFCLHQGDRTVVRQCNKFHNLECRCPEGQILKRLSSSPHTDIKMCQPCPKGHILIRQAERDLDFCEPCRNHTFKISVGQCQECTSCPAINKTELSPCNSTSDSVCEDYNWRNETATNTTDGPTRATPNSIANDWVVVVIFPVCSVVVIALVFATIIIKLRGKRGPKTVINGNPSEDPEETLLPHLQPTTADTEGSDIQFAIDNLDAKIWNKPIFELLSRRLVSWKAFMRGLPGSEAFCSQVEARCDQIPMEYPNDVPEQIYKALLEWSQADEGNCATIRAICNDLDDLGLDQLSKDVREKASTLARENACELYVTVC